MTQFYKYRPVNNFEYLADNLVDQQFYCTPWRKLNDPMEGMIDVYIKDRDRNSLQSKRDDSPLICSFSTDMSEIMMWTHYAQNHKGVAIEFSPSESLKEVTYTKSPLDFDDGISIRDIMWTTKHSRWKYEKEWRYIGKKPNKRFLKGKITKVIFGIRTPYAIKRAINSLCKSNEILTADTHLDTTEYKIVEN